MTLNCHPELAPCDAIDWLRTEVETLRAEIEALRSVVRRTCSTFNDPVDDLDDTPASWVNGGWRLWSRDEADAVRRALEDTE